MMDKEARYRKGLVRAVTRAGVFGGAAYGTGTLIAKRKKDKEQARNRAVAVAGGAAVLPPVAHTIERAALRVIKIGEEKEAAALVKTLKGFRLAAKRKGPVQAASKGQIVKSTRKLDDPKLIFRGETAPAATRRAKKVTASLEKDAAPKWILKVLKRTARRHAGDGAVLNKAKELLKKKGSTPEELAEAILEDVRAYKEAKHVVTKKRLLVGSAVLGGASYLYGKEKGREQEKERQVTLALQSMYRKGASLLKQAPLTAGGKEPNIPSKVREIADAIRRDDSSVSDAKAYRSAWAMYHGTRGDMKERTKREIRKNLPKLEKMKMREAARKKADLEKDAVAFGAVAKGVSKAVGAVAGKAKRLVKGAPKAKPGKSLSRSTYKPMLREPSRGAGDSLTFGARHADLPDHNFVEGFLEAGCAA